MKQTKFGVLLCLLLLVACGRQPEPEAPLADLATSDLFFSEYIEGSSNNKALEIYNGTGAPVDLSAGDYAVEIYFNGNTSPGTTIALTGTVADGDVFVLADNDAAAAILAQADQTSTSNFFNGDDAVVLRKGGTIIDAIGQTGVDPGSQWGSGDTSTQDNTLRRQANVCGGDGNPNDTFDPATAWNGFAQDTLDGLGAHTADCGVTQPGTPALVINELDYDQPSTDTAEFLEIKNTGTAAANLAAFKVQLVNGSNDTVYQTIDLPDVTLAAGDFFVVCGDAAATPNCDLDVSPDTNLIQNGAPDAAALALNGEIVDTLSYEGDVAGYTEGTGATADSESAPFVGLSRSPDGVDTDNNSADFSLRCVTPGGANSNATSDCPDPNSGGGNGEVGQCGDSATLISDVQGSGATSPLIGQLVVIEGVVVGDFQDDNDGPFSDLGGFHLQEEVTDYDMSDETSEGVFVFTGGNDLPNVQVGQTVRVQGTVGEYETSGSSQTQITNPSVLMCGEGTAPDPVDIALPILSRDFLERYEGMLVRFPQNLVISEYFNFDRFGEIVLAQPLPGEDRLYQPTAVAEPGTPEAAARDAYNQLAHITLDDGRSSQNPDPARHPNGNVFDLNNRFRGGDRVQNATGVLDDTFGLYRVQPTQGALYRSVNPRPQQPEAVGGSLKVASFNVLNYFNGNGMGGGFPTSRGADDLGEFRRQKAKIVSAIIGTGADVVGLIEIENDPEGENSALDDLTEALNAQAGAGTYAYIRTGVIGSDEIKVAFVYKPATVTPVGDYAILDASDDPRFRDNRNRPALAQTFREDATSGVFTAVINHFKSKGSGCGAGDDDPLQGNCNGTRRLAAEALADWLASDPTGSSDPDYLIIGDLNAYDKEDPIDALREGADDMLGTSDDYADRELTFEGELAYSYLFDGQFGYLDYALASQSLVPQVTGATTWHINADEPDILDYDITFKQDAQDALFEPNPFRASDHDPVIVGFNLTSSDTEAPAITLKRSSQTLWPPNHKYQSISLTQIVASVSDNVDDLSVADVVITRVTSDEPENGTGDGNTTNDIVFEGCQAVRLRAERSGSGDGRVYTVEVAVKDEAGNVGTASYRVEVPKGRKDAAIDSGTAYSVTGCELP